MRAYGFGEGLIAKATQPRQPSKDEQIAALRAENEQLRAALKVSINAFESIDAVTPWRDSEPTWWLAWSDATDKARAALGKVTS